MFAGLSHPQRARLVAFPIPGAGVRPAYETIFLNVQGGDATAYKFFVDAVTGQVLWRQNAVQQVAAMFAPQTTPFQGTYQDAPAPQMCGPLHSFTMPAGTISIDVVASAAIVSNDIVLKLIFNNVVIATSDTATSPEAIHYEPALVVPGTYQVQVCPFDSPTAPPQPPYSYAGTFTVNDAAGTNNFPYPPNEAGLRFHRRDVPARDYLWMQHDSAVVLSRRQRHSRTDGGIPEPGFQFVRHWGWLPPSSQPLLFFL